MEEETAGSRRKRKEEAKLLKKQRIEESGGVRPRHEQSEESGRPNVSKSGSEGSTGRTAERRSTSSNGRNIAAPSPSATYASHRFGRVMETVPCRNQPRTSTVSIAIPGSIVANCQTRELKTQISGQIARAATIYHVDEIIVFDDKLSKGDFNRNQRSRPQSSARFDKPTTVDAAATFTTGGTVDEKRETEGESSNGGVDGSGEMPRSRLSDPHAFLARILQYCECPQYLRRHFFPMHPDLQFAGLLAPVDAPHHVRAEDRCSFREGVVLDKTHNGSGSLVNCGIRSRPVQYVSSLMIMNANRLFAAHFYIFCKNCCVY